MLKNIDSKYTIPQFALYGEQALNQNPEFVHIEDIADRSSKNGWLIKPHRHTHLFQILFMSEGELELKLDESNSTHKGSWAISIPAGVVHGFRFHPKTKGVVLSLSTDLFSPEAGNGIDALLDDIMPQAHIVEFKAGSSLYTHMLQNLDLIKDELLHSYQDQHLMLYSIIKIVLMTLRRQLQHEKIQNTVHQSEIQQAGKFKNLLEEKYKKHWKISDYAKALHISVSTLNRLCHEAFGTTAKTLIQERLLIEAKRRLIYTRQTLAEISYTLGYKDPAYFSRVFKQTEGVSPKGFRQSQQ